MSDEMDEILNIFFEECDEILPDLERGLSQLSESDSSKEKIDAIFRAVHSIKGGAASFGLERLVRFAHTYESALDCLRAGTVAPSNDIVKIFFSSMDVLSDLVSEAKGIGENVYDERIDDQLKALETVIEKGKGLPSSAEKHDESAVVPENFEPVAFDFNNFDFDESDEGSSTDVSFLVCFTPHRNLYERGDDARNLLLGLRALVPDEFIDAFSVVCEHDHLPELGEITDGDALLSWRVVLPQARGEVTEDTICEVFEWASDACEVTVSLGEDDHSDNEATEDNEPPASKGENGVSEAPPDTTSKPIDEEKAPASPSKPAHHVEQNASIRVELKRISMLMNMIGEMVIGQAALESVLEKNDALGNQELVKSLSTMRSLTREIQDAVMAVRAQPVRNVFQRMQRVVREASSVAQKDIALVLKGEGTEIDRTLIEKLTDPLTHMLRNAIDHGVETPARRRELGKKEQGTISLSAYHRSGRVVIDIRDDGAGINQERVFQIAVQRGVVASDADLSADEINELIFAPGFSTAETVSDLSGRGVGMDVVKRAIQNIGGRVSIKSTPGEGTLFSLSLPLTLAVLDGMLIECRGSTMVVPVTSVIELMTIQVPDDIHVISDGSRVILVRGRCIPLIFLGDALTLPFSEGAISSSARRVERDDQLIVLIVENEVGARAALVVDGIKDQAQVVIKSIEKNYRHIKGVSAATILGDGSVSLILDVSMLISTATKRLDTRAVDQYVKNIA